MDIGLDIVEIGRIRAVARRTPRFLTRVFTDEEIAYCRASKQQWQRFAVRFAAKEAVWKTLGQEGLALKEISVARSLKGKPSVLLRGKPARNFKLSLSHSERYAVAVAVRTR